MSKISKISKIHGTHTATLPTIPTEVYHTLPPFLSQITAHATTPNQRDMLLIATLTTLSSTMPNVTCTYDQKTIYPNLFAYIIGKAASGKGRMDLCRHLVQPIHQALIQDPNKPRIHIIPANSSTSAIINSLERNQGVGLILETEADTIANAFRNDWGGYSDLLRKAGQHEDISKNRVADGYAQVTTPKLSFLVSSTPEQLPGLIPSAENGLASRNLYVNMDYNRQARNPFAPNAASLDQLFAQYGEEYYTFYTHLQQEPHISITPTPQQGARIQQFMQTQLDRTEGLYNADELDASILRMGLQAARIIMILTTLDQMNQPHIPHTITPTDTHVDTALAIINYNMAHTEYILKRLPEVQNFKATTRKDNKELLLEALPQAFSTAQAIQIAATKHVKEIQLKRWLNDWLHSSQIHKPRHGHYEKISNE